MVPSKQKDNKLARFVLYLRMDDPDDQALIADLDHAQRFHRGSQRLRALAQRGLDAETDRQPRAALPAPDDDAKYRVRREAPGRMSEQAPTESPPENGKDALARATSNFMDAFGREKLG